MSQDTHALSKTQLKKLRKREKLLEGRKESRKRSVEARRAKAAELKRLVRLGLADPPQKSSVVNNYTLSHIHVLIDLDFEQYMNPRLIASLHTQLSYLYSANRRAHTQLPLICAGLGPALLERLKIRHEFDRWRNIEWWTDPLSALWSPQQGAVAYGPTAGSSQFRTDRENVVYLTGDSPNVLDSFDPGKVYVIGGIVDHNQQKNICLHRANELGIRHAALPIKEHMSLVSRKILAVNHVFEIILHYAASRDWRSALEAVIPTRKIDISGKEAEREIDINGKDVSEDVTDNGSLSEMAHASDNGPKTNGTGGEGTCEHSAEAHV